ncbi:flagellar type III secretion system protein FlhB [Paracoccus sp. MBLB3053]|uniref:Flagellar type III secretion system protein FlhB n=1 Tax=Paracoccus aurantius TaxID=3073814 RepID=A0ABU2HPH3_9RHOB|nr:flagellar type III secretion system protein FlhB [Paracoccus sp. MBLB3053]MDS9466947.1 flagellar type III secretion system protein FlhB [Paracoccus sp. MBLB3053]
MSDQDEDKAYEASEQKLRRAREQGDIARATELNSALSYLGLWAAVLFIANWAAPSWLAMAARALGAEPWPDGRGRSTMDMARALSGHAGLACVACAAIIALPVLVGLIAQRAIVISPKKLMPDFNRINPVKNAAQKFGRSGLASFTISLFKVVLVGAGGWLLYAALLGRVLSAEAMSDLQWVAGLRLIVERVVQLAIGTGLVLGLIDLLWKRHEFLTRQRMSRKEMQDEFKESEGDPHMRSARRQKAVDIVLNSMLADIEKADVVIVNPTHYAVALEWKRGSGRAPVCLAKGVDQIALKIRERALENQVPIWSDPPCARALYATVGIGEEVQHEHFAPVAAAIRFAEAMRKKMREGWGGSSAERKRDRK